MYFASGALTADGLNRSAINLLFRDYMIIYRNFGRSLSRKNYPGFT